MMTFARRTYFLLLTLAATPALAQSHDMPMHDQQSGASHDMMASMDKMNSGMAAAPMTGDPDRDFVSMMIPHHQGAVDMAETELRYGKDAVIRHLAREIIAAQKKEIAFMRHWQVTHAAH
ncbi:MAG TPA: DUF305 domain-containing protein [Acetobacteraceae bacterium]|jgi:uncharacterized protein (DUF305 family)|nr:DUF305 domain-containing protein [Acetobacteraceae bacterium]